MQAIILAAGIGSRLAPYTDSVPKPLMPISFKDGKVLTLLEKIINQVKAAKIKDIFIVVNYKKEMIRDFLKDGSAFGVNISYVFQDQLDGNGGALYRCQDLVNEDVLFTDCDNFIDDDKVFLKLRGLFEKSRANAVVGVKRVDDITRFAIFKLDKKGKIIDIYEKPTNEKEWGNMAKTGFAIVSKNIIKMDRKICLTDKMEYATTQMFKYMIQNNMKVVPFLVEADFEDVGTWESYMRILHKNKRKK